MNGRWVLHAGKIQERRLLLENEPNVKREAIVDKRPLPSPRA